MFGVEPKLGGHLLVVPNDVVGLLLWRAAGALCGAFDVDAVFVSFR